MCQPPARVPGTWCCSSDRAAAPEPGLSGTRGSEPRLQGKAPCVHRPAVCGVACPSLQPEALGQLWRALPSEPRRPRCGLPMRQRGRLSGVVTRLQPSEGVLTGRGFPPIAIHSLYWKRRLAPSCLYISPRSRRPPLRPLPIRTALGWPQRSGPGQQPRGCAVTLRMCVWLAPLSALCLGVSRGRGPPGLWAPPPDEDRDRPIGQRLDDAPGLKPRESLHGRAGQVHDLVSRPDRLRLPRGCPWEGTRRNRRR